MKKMNPVSQDQLKMFEERSKSKNFPKDYNDAMKSVSK